MLLIREEHEAKTVWYSGLVFAHENFVKKSDRFDLWHRCFGCNAVSVSMRNQMCDL